MERDGLVAERTAPVNGNTVSLRELYSMIEALKEWLDERDRRYQEARESDGKAVEAAFKASEKAIEKAETARSVHDAAINEWRQQFTAQELRFLPKNEYDNKMKDIAATLQRIGGEMLAFPSKTEVTGKFDVHDNRFKTVEGRVQALETIRSEELGRMAQSQGDRTQNSTTVGMVVGVMGMLGGVAIGVAGLLLK